MESRQNSLNNPLMHENPELRWSFIRKVYAITTFQLLLTVLVVSILTFVHPVANFFFNSIQGTVLATLLILLPLITLRIPMGYYQQHPLNYFLLLFFNVSSALSVGLAWSFDGGTMILEVVVLITIMMFILTLYTFWGARKDHDLSHLGSFLFGAWSILIFLSLVQMMFVLEISSEKLLSHYFGCLVSILFCGCIACGTNFLVIVKTFTYNQHIVAFVVMYPILMLYFSIPLFIVRYM